MRQKNAVKRLKRTITLVKIVSPSEIHTLWLLFPKNCFGKIHFPDCRKRSYSNGYLAKHKTTNILIWFLLSQTCLSTFSKNNSLHSYGVCILFLNMWLFRPHQRRHDSSCFSCWRLHYSHITSTFAPCALSCTLC